MKHDKRTRKPASARLTADTEPPEIAALRAEGGETAVARLRELALGDDRALAKAARRVLHVLGAAVPPPPDAGLMPGSVSEALAHEAWATGYGFRCRGDILVAREEPFGSAWSLASCLTSAETGIVECFSARAGRARMKDALDAMIVDHGPVLVAKVPLPFARWFLADAIKRSSPAGVAQIRAERVDVIVGNGGAPEMAERFAALEADTSVLENPPLDREPVDLCKVSPFSTWFSDDGPTAPWIDRARAAFHSPLALDEWQMRNRLRAVQADAADALLTPNVLAAMRHATLVNALLFEVTDRPKEARMAQYHALSCRLDRPARDWPLGLYVVERTITAVLYKDVVTNMSDEELEELEAEEDDDRVSLIIRP